MQSGSSSSFESCARADQVLICLLKAVLADRNEDHRRGWGSVDKIGKFQTRTIRTIRSLNTSTTFWGLLSRRLKEDAGLVRLSAKPFIGLCVQPLFCSFQAAEAATGAAASEMEAVKAAAAAQVEGMKSAAAAREKAAAAKAKEAAAAVRAAKQETADVKRAAAAELTAAAEIFEDAQKRFREEHEKRERQLGLARDTAEADKAAVQARLNTALDAIRELQQKVHSLEWQLAQAQARVSVI